MTDYFASHETVAILRRHSESVTEHAAAKRLRDGRGTGSDVHIAVAVLRRAGDHAAALDLLAKLEPEDM